VEVATRIPTIRASVRGMQSVRLLSDLGVQQAGGSDSDPA